VGNSPALGEVYKLVEAVAPTDVTVLIEGESGVGKELVAHEIHRRSLRGAGKYVTVDCCSLHETLFESELFGHERGAFTGADRKKIGLIETAEGGTLFLDEIGEIDASVQAKLLRVLETGRFRRLGGTKDLECDVRIIAATNRNLEQMSHLQISRREYAGPERRETLSPAYGSPGAKHQAPFRPDLYFRLSRFVIRVPPLREHREDIPDLAKHFVGQRRFALDVTKSFSGKAIKRLTSYDWPGNVRELRNVVERAIIVSGREPKIRAEHLTFSPSGKDASIGTTLSFSDEPTLQDVEVEYFKNLLDKYSGHREQVAHAAGISVRNLYRLIKKYQLD
jgi:transcriptional regulator with PAS, ATPase and Fis domain